MGNSDSKAKDGEATVQTKTSQSKSDDFTEEKKEAYTPRRKLRADIPSTHITDDQIQVNLAMADLMAYLQVVANNSNHLPLTRRDDPELDRTSSNLSSDEYAKKSAAFIPADVRILGGVFTRYGRVWDLPTSEEYNAVDGAHEPGRSYGGACANSMLKVLYDAANDAAAQQGGATDALFADDDDEEEEEEVGSLTGRSYKSGFSLEYNNGNPTTMTWSELLRKMKAEVKDIEYAQVPKITSTRKFDLGTPFSLIPENFDSAKGTKRSLLIGCNYHNIPEAELKASHDDVRSMKDYIVNVHGFSEAEDAMTILMDDGQHEDPTFLNIIESFKALSEQSQPGDAVFVMFSGHGGRVLDAPIDAEAESYDETIVPADYVESGLIRDTLIFKTLLAPMRYGVTVTVIIDCCDNGMVMELPYSWSTKNDRKDATAKLGLNEDFSFVRALKVVKTLYESSQFTQLGRTVGIALSPLQELDKPTLDGTSESMDESRTHEAEMLKSTGSTIFEAIAEACSAHKTKKVQPDTEATLSNPTSPAKQSLLEQVINCTLLSPGGEENFSFDEDDTYRTGERGDTFDEDYDDEYRSYDSEDEESRRRRRRRSRRRR